MNYNELYSSKKEKPFESVWWFLAILAIVLSTINIVSRFEPKYYYITDNIEIKDVSASQLFSICSHEDDAWYMSFEGKYDGTKATVSLYPEVEECTLFYDNDGGQATIYAVELYALATIRDDDYFYLNAEYAFSFLYR